MPKEYTVIKEGDLVRVKTTDGGTGENRYQVTSIGPGTRCAIREWPGIEGVKMRSQEFDTSLLVVDNSGPPLLEEVLNAPFQEPTPTPEPEPIEEEEVQDEPNPPPNEELVDIPRPRPARPRVRRRPS